MAPLVVAVCLKLVDRWPEVDALTGAVRADERLAGASDADLAALEWALCCQDRWSADVLAVTAGPPPAEAVLREALAAGAGRAVRVDLDAGADSAAVAAALAPGLAGCALVWCGDQSLDRGSGSVPAFLAAHLGAAQALGLVEATLDGDRPGRVQATRRLERGWRERLRVDGPAVLSVEGATARLRRAPLGGALAARASPIEVEVGPPAHPPPVLATRPYRPRPRFVAPPEGGPRERIRSLTSAGTTAAAARASSAPVVAASPADAVDRILAALAAWGELPVADGAEAGTDPA